MRLLALLFALLLLAPPANASLITLPYYPFVAHTPLLANQLNLDFTEILDDYNGNITNANLSATAGITVGKLTSSGNGYLPIGNSGNTFTNGRITSTGSSLTITNGSGTINADIAPDVIKHVTVPISSANILAMYGAPVQLIAAGAAGTNIVVHKIMFKMTTTATQYANGGAVVFQLGNTIHGAGTATTATIAAAVVNAAGPATSYGTVIPVSYVGSAATGLFISNDTAAFDTGTGTAVVDIWYSLQ